MSTATERIMRERGDLRCFHEPFMYYYYLHLKHRLFPHHEVDPAQPTEFRAIWEKLFEAAETGPVFFKDMAYYVCPEILAHPALARTIRHAFLIRDPRRAIVSYHRLDPELHADEVGLEAQWTLADWVARQTGERPPVVEAESIQREPEAAVGALWARLGLESRPKAFHWEEDRLPDDWRQVSGWHQGVRASTGIKPPDDDEGKIERQFTEAAAAAPRLHDLLGHHLPSYLKLRAWSLSSDAAPLRDAGEVVR